ncbi:hypothetical protein MTO96_009737 [Rhipicephalus appendiculatus]
MGRHAANIAPAPEQQQQHRRRQHRGDWASRLQRKYLRLAMWSHKTAGYVRREKRLRRCIAPPRAGAAPLLADSFSDWLRICARDCARRWVARLVVWQRGHVFFEATAASLCWQGRRPRVSKRCLANSHIPL